jgi:hypothetical protein
MIQLRAFSKLAVTLSLVAVACGVGVPGGNAGTTGAIGSLTLSKVCTKTHCDNLYESCQRFRDNCFSQCSYMGYEYAAQCLSVCVNHECTPCSTDVCVEQGYEFSISAPRDEKLFAACEDYHRKLVQCGGDASFLDCDRFARLERPEVGASYECYANAPCGSDPASCEPAPTRWGQDFCVALDDRCGEAGPGCTEETANWLSSAAAWLKDDVRDAAMSCLGEAGCGQIEACVFAWFATVFPSAS